MKLTELQKIGLATLMLVFDTEDELIEAFEKSGQQVAGKWMNATEEQKEELIKSAKSGAQNLLKITEENL